MGANCSRAISSLKEGRKYIEEQANNAGPLQPDGDACIIDVKTKQVHIYRFILTNHQWRVVKRPSKDKCQVRPILPTIAGIFGAKPTEKKHLIAMVRLD